MQDATADAPRPPRRRLFTRLLAVLVSLIVTAAAVEGAVRVHGFMTDSPWSASAARARVSFVRDTLFKRDWRAPDEEAAENNVQVLHPYVGFEAAVTQRLFATLAEETRKFDPEQVLQVGIVGGSVSCILAADSGARIAEALSRDPRLGGRRVTVHVLGQGGMKQPQQAMVTAWALAMGWHLDVLINVDGFNEVAIGNQNLVDSGSHPLYPYHMLWSHITRARTNDPEVQRIFVATWLARERAGAWCDRALAPGVLTSAVVGKLVVRKIEQHAKRFIDLQLRYSQSDHEAKEANVSLRGPPHSTKLSDVLDTIVESWYQCSLSISALCERRGIRYLHVLQPTLNDTGSKRLTKQELGLPEAPQSWVDACREGYPRLREAGVRLTASGVNFLDASRIFEEDTRELYYDPCHFRKPGSDMLADLIVERLLEILQ